MDSTTGQQAYDRGNTIFSPDGRLYQVEYAREAVKRGSPSVGVATDDGVVLAARKRVRSSLLEAETIEKIHEVDDHLAIASAGHAADARQLVDVARRVAQHHRVRYGEPIGVEPLATHLADHVQEHTQTGGSRPFGAALLVAGIDPDRPGGSDVEPRLFEVDPSGTPYGWRAVSIGNGTDEISGFFEDRLDGGGPLDRRRGTTAALEALEATAEGDGDAALEPESLDVWTIDSETGTVDEFSTGEIEAVLAALE
ncbi:archaeal proteasome endopeptidase complex subunit alpha [Natronorubrum halophilum]|uniref:archaeal proteasome endopeptidase complex subunit alpha n=1 Tax=Natronorubrum halophilum TaxID=1702106 RepID=UPI000EF6A943|nr:archaeal proteasome endopeptidase complex subunit alpha [Natronorubrum halophilum]